MGNCDVVNLMPCWGCRGGSAVRVLTALPEDPGSVQHPQLTTTGSLLPVSPAPESPIPLVSSGLSGHCTHMYKSIHRQTSFKNVIKHCPTQSKNYPSGNVYTNIRFTCSKASQFLLRTAVVIDVFAVLTGPLLSGQL